MYQGFNLSNEFYLEPHYYRTGEKLYKENTSATQSAIDNLKDTKGNIIASKVIQDWFPNTAKDIFLSHSHKDKDYVISLAGWLHDEFGLTSFIDSCIWGYADRLLRMIDDEYCFNEESSTYNYQKRNRSTSHVYMMLSTALADTMNNCECVFFVNTPNSLNAGKYIEGDTSTYSPWIFAEIAMMRLMNRRKPSEHRPQLTMDSFEAYARSQLEVKYDLSLDHLLNLKPFELTQWKESNQSWGAKSLDTLYKLKGLMP